MKKAVLTLTAAAFLGGAAATMTPAPAHAVYPIFLAFAKADPDFQSVNPYDKKPVRHHKRHRARR